jgi:P27 family predicted phage terminase small subunit
MRKGRRPRPTALKLLQGERQSRIVEDPPEAQQGAPAAPDALDEQARAAYRMLVGLLEPSGILTQLDGLALAAFAQVVVEHERASALVNQVGPLIRDEHGLPRTNPAYRIRRDTGRDILRWAMEFGMTPAARSQISRRLSGGAAPARDPIAQRYLSS